MNKVTLALVISLAGVIGGVVGYVLPHNTTDTVINDKVTMKSQPKLEHLADSELTIQMNELNNKVFHLYRQQETVSAVLQELNLNLERISGLELSKNNDFLAQDAEIQESELSPAQRYESGLMLQHERQEYVLEKTHREAEQRQIELQQAMEWTDALDPSSPPSDG